ncbi:MAG: translesion DNA synthesis-associated protein ImuA [Gammaproteobacteria bacterium]|nr:translesion DNA synthesis-associated protein ImuA [Gammaproteobacteria bacterium]
MSGLQTLLSKDFIWRARDLAVGIESASGIPTGFDSLDRLLHDRGWPRDALLEMLVDNQGCGELRLIMPGLRHLLHQDTRWLAWINPPFVPYAPALHSLGIDVNRVLLVHPNSHKEALWALEKILESGSCSAVLAWLNEQELQGKQLRRIQSRAKENRVWVTIFRPSRVARVSSPAEFRFHIHSSRSNTGDRMVLSVLKRKGGWAVNDVSLRLQWHPNALSTDYMAGRWNLWRRLEQTKEITRRIA